MNKTRHTDLARDLAEGIAGGRFPVGSLLPTEFELCDRYGASRYTVRKALDELQELGLISRRKNVGTRVEASGPTPGFTQSIATVDELAQFGATHVRQVREVKEIVADLALAKELGCPGGTRWLRISSLRMDGGKKSRPIGWTDVYIDASYTEVPALVRESPQELISSLIEKRYGRRIACVQQEVNAVSLSKALSEPLVAEAGSPALKIVRRYLDSSDVPFEISVSIHPADRFTFSMQMNRARE
ncbi:GntR family transcriptional regulator [uncultured Azohydromonas sp.]|jgi:Transcriptional regulators|uniref:GntR family transcriptional regulator n=1 Tax=uncultured Azohydromonas sp. TaxID=487342 RepID=UPI0026228242|nr:GntR family transcriptional regulator [uncultured Azohydromonas sp.]